MSPELTAVEEAQVDHAMKNIRDLIRFKSTAIEMHKTTNKALRADNEALKEQLKLVRSVAVDEVNSIPRTINGDELRLGQIIAAYTNREDEHMPVVVAGKVIDLEAHPAQDVDMLGLHTLSFQQTVHFCVRREGDSSQWWDVSTFSELHLLADAPEGKLGHTLPTEPGSLIEVTEGDCIHPGPTLALLDDDSTWYTPYESLAPEQITGWRPMKVAPS